MCLYEHHPQIIEHDKKEKLKTSDSTKATGQKNVTRKCDDAKRDDKSVADALVNLDIRITNTRIHWVRYFSRDSRLAVIGLSCPL